VKSRPPILGGGVRGGRLNDEPIVLPRRVRAHPPIGRFLRAGEHRGEARTCGLVRARRVEAHAPALLLCLTSGRPLKAEGARPPLFGAYLRPSWHRFIRIGFRAFELQPHIPRIDLCSREMEEVHNHTPLSGCILRWREPCLATGPVTPCSGPTESTIKAGAQRS
jgi:hypothetical protein